MVVVLCRIKYDKNTLRLVTVQDRVRSSMGRFGRETNRNRIDFLCLWQGVQKVKKSINFNCP